MTNNPLAKISVLQLKRAVAIREQMQTLQNELDRLAGGPKCLWEDFRCPAKEKQNERGGQGQTLRDDDGQVGEDQGGKGQEISMVIRTEGQGGGWLDRPC